MVNRTRRQCDRSPDRDNGILQVLLFGGRVGDFGGGLVVYVSLRPVCDGGVRVAAAGFFDEP